MQNPGTLYRTQLPGAGSSRSVAIGFVALIHLIVIYGLVTGLAQRIVVATAPELIAEIVPPPAKPEALPAPPLPAPKTVAEPKLDTVPPPVFQIATPTPSNAPQALAQQAPAAAPADSGPSAIADSRTTPPYPPSARRLGQTGTVVLHLTIDSDGTVTGATVVTSSGTPELDQAAVDWVTAHWRYHPAMQGGVAVASTALTSVKFQLTGGN